MQLGDLGDAVRSPAGPGGARRKDHIWCISGMKMLSLTRPSMQLEVWESAVYISYPCGSGRSPVGKRHLVHFWSENALSRKALAS